MLGRVALQNLTISIRIASGTQMIASDMTMK
jgi:hypothetical protein